MSVRSSLSLALALGCPVFAALYACGSSTPVSSPPDASVPDTSVPDTSMVPDVGPYDSGGVFPCDMKLCGLGTEVCCYSGAGTGACMAFSDAAALPVCPAGELDCAATGDCTSGVCCAQQQGTGPLHALCLSSCQVMPPVTIAVVLCNGPYDTSTCKGGKTCMAAPGSYPSGYYYCSK
jgi:hypothetical protein